MGFLLALLLVVVSLLIQPCLSSFCLFNEVIMLPIRGGRPWQTEYG